jgi:hypothetical protein
MDQSITVHNSYTNSDGDNFPGTDGCFIRSFHDDSVGGGSPGYPEVLQENGYVRAKRQWQQQPLTVSGTKVPGTGAQPGADHFSGDWGNLFGLGYDPTADNEHFSLGEAEVEANNRLTMKLIGQLQYNNFHVGEVFHTRQQAANMVGDVTRRIGSCMRNLRSGNVGGAIAALGGSNSAGRRGDAGRITRLVGGVPEQYLALMYGWKPLLSDVYNSVEICRQAYSDDGNVVRAQDYVGVKLPNKSHFIDADPGWGPSIEYIASGRKVSVKGFIDYSISGTGLLHSLSQLGITNPAGLAWELLPLSFVVDWFLPVGQFLNGLNYALGLSFVKGSYCFKHHQTWRSRLVRTQGTRPGGYTASWSGGTGSGEGFYMRRNVLHTFPLPPLPTFKDPFSPTHMAEGLSLLSQAFSGNIADSYSY